MAAAAVGLGATLADGSAGRAGGASRRGGSLREQAGDGERARKREDVVVFHDMNLLWGRWGCARVLTRAP